MKWYQDHGTTTSGLNMVIQSGGGIFLGGGEAPNKHYLVKTTDDTDPNNPVHKNYTGEETFITSDSPIHIQTNAGTITNRKGLQITNSLQLVPEQEDVATNNIGSIGTSSYRWANGYFTNGYFKLLNGINDVDYTKEEDSGDTKYPAKWYCNMGKTPADGDTVTITVPAEGGDSNGVYLSIEGNTNAKYKPISVSKTTKLTTHFSAGEIITLVYRAAGSTATIYPVNGGTATTTVSGGCWSVLNYYNTNTDTKVTQINTTNTTEDDSYRILFSNTADNTNRTEAARKSAYLLFTPNSKTLTTTNLSVTDNLYIGKSDSTTGKIYFFSTSNNTSMYGRIEQTFNSTQSNLVHKLPSTSGTLLNDSIFKTIYNDEGTSSQFPSGDISYDITDFKEKIKFMDIHYTDANYLKDTSTGQQKSENFGYLRIPFDLIKDGGFVASATPTIRFSLSLIGDQNSYYFRKQTYGFYVLQSGSAQSGNQTYTLYIQKLAQGLTTQFYGTPGTAPNWGNMTVRAHLKDDVIRILRITLILDP